eukprot:jgi/Picre1/27783/NNA_000747.t1
MERDLMIAMRIIEVRLAYAKHDFEWHNLQSLCLDTLEKENVTLLRQHAMDHRCKNFLHYYFDSIVKIRSSVLHMSRNSVQQKTPQWREGPYGPKTLCNACGVKRTRKLRAEQDGGKRKRSNGGQGNAKVKVVRGTSQALEQHPVLHPTEDFVKRPSHQLQGQNSINSGKIGADAVRRPTRKAAEEAAFRTARYAKTGEWGNLNSSSPMKKSMFKFDVNGNQTGSSSSDVISGPFSDVPEETAWMPHEKVVGGGSSPYTPDCAVRTSDDCFAAINLMTMSAKNSLEDTFFSQPRHGTPESSPLKMYPSNADVEAALNKVADLCGGVFSDSNISILSQSVPPSKVSDLIKLTDELSDMQHTVSEAETEVSALAAMLAVKQAALLEKQIPCKYEYREITPLCI